MKRKTPPDSPHSSARNLRQEQETPEPFPPSQQESSESLRNSQQKYMEDVESNVTPQPLPVQQIPQEQQQRESDPNEDYCRFCKAAGELVCCEQCPSAWHTYCVVPPLKEVPKGLWICPLCDSNRNSLRPIKLTKMALCTVKSKKEGKERKKKTEEKEEKLVNTSSPWYDCLAMVKVLCKHRHSWPFSDPVNPERLNIPDYHIYVPLPMDLSTVEGKLNSQVYRNMNDFANDIRLIWSNTETYNGPDHLVTTMAYQLREIFEKMFESREKYWRDYFVTIPYTKRRTKHRPNTFKMAFQHCNLKKPGRKTSNSAKAASSLSRSGSVSLSQSTSTVAPPSPSNTSTQYPVNTHSHTTPHVPVVMTYNLPAVRTSPNNSNTRGNLTRQMSSGMNDSPTSSRTASTPNTKYNSRTNASPASGRGTGPIHSMSNYPQEGAQQLGNSGSYPGASLNNSQNIRQSIPVQYIRIYFDKKTIKTDRNSFPSLRSRLNQCFRLNDNFKLYYWDSDGTKIDVFDDKCFNIFLQSTGVKKNLYMEKTKN